MTKSETKRRKQNKRRRKRGNEPLNERGTEQERRKRDDTRQRTRGGRDIKAKNMSKKHKNKEISTEFSRQEQSKTDTDKKAMSNSARPPQTCSCCRYLWVKWATLVALSFWGTSPAIRVKIPANMGLASVFSSTRRRRAKGIAMKDGGLWGCRCNPP